MIKHEVIALIAQSTADAGKTPVNHKQVDEVLKALAKLVGKTVSGPDGKMTVPYLGMFKEKVRSARTCRNPRTGEPVEVAAKKTIAFLPKTDLLSSES